ncbi:ABC-type transport system, permease and ATPase components [Alteracholeplasma palmae J233]|uniref:ABC-type transport system, permease and ATPase components n=1 Tax=Alteracholeplasma palmae (strain ATCC 49389 / J233) TaxID=1318466 RepID=U4KKI6_ALTPJ|nr:ABC transporter ATP-binding protein [Alteracholeplasma palmae]CCV64132.1 ABC-type transport system, permease and ATPase components [Alteracholeplasma palmae J233]
MKSNLDEDFKKTNTNDKKLLQKTLRYIKPYKKQFISAFIFMAMTVLLDLLFPFLSGLAIDVMSNQTITTNQKYLILVIATVILVIVVLITQVVAYYQQVILQKIGFDITDTIRQEVFIHIEKLAIGQINEIPIGKLVTRATNDPNAISDMYTNVIINLIRNIVYLVVILITLYVINWLMALVVTALLPFILISAILFKNFSRKAYRNVRTNVTNVNAFLSENLSGMKVTQIFNQENKKINEFRKRNKELTKSYMTEIYIFGIFRPFIYFLAMSGTVLTIIVGQNAIENGLITVGSFVTFYLLVGQFFEPIQQMSEQFNALQSGFASSEKVFDVLETEPDITDEIDAINLESFKGHIEFKNVWFYYENENWILKDVSFEVKPSETVAFVGSTGSGKSTILGLIVRNYDIQKGQILIDGIDIKHITRSSLRRQIGQMLQDVFLFSGSIYENINLKDENITLEDAKKASEYVGADTFINELEGQYDYKVLERGNNFSSGQRQLISFARAVAYKPSLMILDEATANIDSETENLIQESLKKMMNISTMLIVAHRLSTIQHSDKIIVMQKGEIKEMGNHQQLLKKKGIYHGLYQLQFDKSQEK